MGAQILLGVGMSFLTMKFDKSLIQGLTAGAGLAIDAARSGLASSDFDTLNAIRLLTKVRIIAPEIFVKIKANHFNFMNSPSRTRYRRSKLTLPLKCPF